MSKKLEQVPGDFITKVNIEKFRHLKDVSFKIGKRLTVIAGSNGTGKTSVLGLIGHIFTYPTVEKTLFNRPFETLFSEVFRFSVRFDRAGEHKYSLVFADGTVKHAQSREATEGGRQRFRIDVGERTGGEGKIVRPVIYLGLKRLIPLAQEKESSIKIGREDKLSNEYKSLFKDYYNRIFATDINVTPEHTKSTNKENYSPTAENYDSFGISAGQDTVGQIILSLISFYHLKKTSSDYTHGVFIIDELDATLYPAAQKNLLELLLRESNELNLQVIFTTHSTDILNYISSKTSTHFKHHTEFVFLNNTSGQVAPLQGPNILEDVVADLNHETARYTKPKRVNIYFEDAEGKTFFNNLIKGTGINKKVKTQDVSLGAGNYVNLLKARFPEFNNSLVVLDGDFKPQLRKRFRKKVVFLPGNIRPESLVKDFLQQLPENDPFWDSIGGYTKRVFLQQSLNLNGDRDSMKIWFKKEKKHWGKGCAKLFRRWKERNNNEVISFLEELNKKVSLILE